MKSALILYPNQLFPADQLPEVHTVVIVEEPLYFGMDQEHLLKLHKQKLILQRAAMQRYVEEVLWPADYQVDYVELDVFMATGDVLDRVKGFEKVYLFDPVDEVLTARLLIARREREDGPPVEFLPSPNFYLKEPEIREYFGDKPKPFAEFYQWQRERFNILIDENYKPTGGKWMLEAETAEKLPKGQTPPSFGVFGDSKHVLEAVKWVEEHFPDNPGSSDFIWPTDHQEATTWLEDFVENRLDGFATYQDVIDSKAPWLYHSALASSLNLGLLSPQQVVSSALERHKKRPVDLANLESFIRHILGGREYTRSLYVMRGPSIRGYTEFKNQRRMTNAWYSGDLGLPPFDDLARKLQAHGYAHQIEGQLIAGNLMMLCEIHPEDMQHWFGQLFVDTYDWTLIPNLYAISQFSEELIDSKVTIGGSEAIIKLSDYKRDLWADVWDGLFWRFVEKHKEALKHNKRTKPLVKKLEQLDPDRKRIVNYRAEDFLTNFTR